MVHYEKAAYSSCHGLRYHLEGPCSHYFVLQLGSGARDVLRYLGDYKRFFYSMHLFMHVCLHAVDVCDNTGMDN